MTDQTTRLDIPPLVAVIHQLAAKLAVAKSEQEIGHHTLLALAALPKIVGGWLEVDDLGHEEGAGLRLVAHYNLPSSTELGGAATEYACHRESMSGGESHFFIQACTRRHASLDPACHLLIPLRVGERRMGLIHLLTDCAAALEPEVLTACQTIASLVALALAGGSTRGTSVTSPAPSQPAQVDPQRMQDLMAALRAGFADSDNFVALVDPQRVFTLLDAGERSSEHGPQVLFQVGGADGHDEQLAPDVRARLDQALTHSLDQSMHDRFEYRDQAAQWWSVRTRPIPVGSATCALVLVSNITAAKVTEAMVTESERRFRAIFSTQYQFIGLLSPDGNLLEANESALKFGGIAREDVVGRPFWQAPWWATSPQVQIDLQAAVARAAQGEFVRYEVEVRGSGDSTAVIDFSLTPIQDESGRVVLLIPEGRNITELKRAEEQLRFQANILHQITDAVVATDMQERITYWGAAAEKMYGLRAQEAIGRKLTDCYVTEWETPDQRAAALQSLVNQGVWRGDVTQELRSGERIPVEALVSLYRTVDGSPAGIIAVLHGIAPRLRMEAELRASEERFRTSLDSLLDSFGIYSAVRDDQGTIVDFTVDYVNRAACEGMGVPFAGQVGRRLLEFLPAHHTSGLFDLYAQVVETGKPLISNAFRFDDILGGRAYHVYVENRAYKLGDGFAVAWRDVTNREQAVAALRDSEQRLALALDVTGAGIFDFHIPAQDDDYFSPNFWTILGYSGDSSISLTERMAWLRRQFHPEDVDALAQAFYALIDGQIPVVNVEARVRHRGGHWVYGQQFATAAERDAQGRATRIIGVLLDISQRKQIELELRRQALELARSNADLEQFAYVASHDLQEPLRMVSSYVQLLVRRHASQLGPDAAEFIAYIQDGTARMQNLIKALLAYSRVSTQGQPFAAVDLAAVLSHVLAAMQWTLDEAQATITSDALPIVLGDEVQLSQVLHNLVVNSVKFRSSAPPDIQIRVTDTGQEWQFGVRDNGIGLDPKFAERIFVLFQRLHTQEEYQGTGIGLALCKKIVERHGGRIWAESQPGAGTTIRFTLPYQTLAHTHS